MVSCVQIILIQDKSLVNLEHLSSFYKYGMYKHITYVPLRQNIGTYVFQDMSMQIVFSLDSSNIHFSLRLVLNPPRDTTPLCFMFSLSYNIVSLP